MGGPNARPCKHTDERVTCAPTEDAEPGLRRPCVFRRGLATYPHSPKMPATGSDRNRADPTRLTWSAEGVGDQMRRQAPSVRRPGHGYALAQLTDNRVHRS